MVRATIRAARRWSRCSASGDRGQRSARSARSGRLEPCRAAVGGRIEDEPTIGGGAVSGDEARLARLAARDEVAELRRGEAAAGGLEPDDEAAALAPPRAAPAALAGDQR